MRILVTGADGFVGRSVCGVLAETADVVGSVRFPSGISNLPTHVTPVCIGEVDGSTAWDKALRGVNTVVHLAARVHILRETESDPTAKYRSVNTEGTRKLAAESARHGVRRLILMSSLGVLGSASPVDHEGRVVAFRGEESPHPSDPYTISKRDAEDALRQVAAESGLEYVILRPPLVYGPEMRGNLLLLLDWIWRGWPLPFGRVQNRRSFVGVENVADLIRHCVLDDRAVGKSLLLSDALDISTPDLIRRLATHLGRHVSLWPVPVWLLRAAGSVTRRSRTVSRLVDSLVVDPSMAWEQLGWQPPYSIEDGLQKTCRWYVDMRAGKGE